MVLSWSPVTAHSNLPSRILVLNKSTFTCVIHVESNTIIWSANRDAPISDSDAVSLTTNGITIANQGGVLRWSTPPLPSSIYALKLTELGNLILLDHSNGSLWESFFFHIFQRHQLVSEPQHLLGKFHQFEWLMLVIGQHLPVGTYLSSAVSDNNLSFGDYMLTISTSDALLQWHNQTYWKLSKNTEAYINSNYIVEYMAINRTGLYLFGQNESLVVIQVILLPADFQIAKLGASGHLTIIRYFGTKWDQEFFAPTDDCKTPFICGRIGLCNDGLSSGLSCSCPSGFHMGLGYGTEYFANDFSEPLRYHVNLSVCEDLCSGDCSCLGFFHGTSTGSCHVLENELGSVMSSNDAKNDLLGYIKVLTGQSTNGVTSVSSRRPKIPVAALVLLPFTGFFLLGGLGFLGRKRWGLSKSKEIKLGHCNSHSSEDLDVFYITGLPKRFDYDELEGTLLNKTVVAIKKITNLGVQRRKEFCTEIAVIRNIHHVNLVRLKGFCAQGRKQLLVYEYMNHGSLDLTVFARGLAYLHNGCKHKIIHCDVKPENILLDDHLQAKISDFGLSKLLSPDQSGLFTTMRGTRGYLTPEWLTNSAILKKTNVYSFGMVLPELVSGRKNSTDNDSGGGHSSSSSGSGFGYYPLFALEMHEQGKNQHLIVTIVGMLEGGIPIIQPIIESMNFLRFYGRRFTKASTIMELNGSMSYPLANASRNTSGLHAISGPR
ncbi:hypothetical protein CIPAW_05G225300 [Carya illinoinensis]|uniref:Receptor-like serine/threonine-protein kinase n=1 Tax=Carya illinoinensis TaxID=32201 RepID=A0A8T1QLY7_CARIL|nr:hypothetical protein CIPAW_05G225300 [Carya illinoinensis]